MDYFESDYRVYQLLGTALSGYTRGEMERIFPAARDALPGSQRLIIVDDAHLLQRPEEIWRMIREALAEGDTYVLWIQTHFDDEVGFRPDAFAISIDLTLLEPKLREFVEAATASAQARSGIHLNTKSAVSAYKAGRIRNAWHFMFVASLRYQRLARELRTLTDIELITLFELAVDFLLYRGEPRSYAATRTLLDSLPFGWLKDDLRRDSFADVISRLSKRTQERGALLNLTSRQIGGTWIDCLHVNFAREVLREAFSRGSLTPDMNATIAVVLDTNMDALIAPWLVLRAVPQTIEDGQVKNALGNYLAHTSPSNWKDTGFSLTTFVLMSVQMSSMG